MKHPDKMTFDELLRYCQSLKLMIAQLQATIRRMEAERDDHDSHDETAYPQHP
jgi:uncharacterized small protein (DUF1192 family)